MNYTKLQKILSSLTLFFVFFNLVLTLPVHQFSFSQAFASDEEYSDLVAIVVEEEAYNAIKSRVKRYARDIQGVLENTETVIVPTPKDTPVHSIASLHEKLFFEGQEDLGKNTLVGTVLIGDLALPYVFENNEAAQTILPYVDFSDKRYIFDEVSAKYLPNKEFSGDFSAEIWHGVIAPNSGDADEDIDALKKYFDKNHDFYTQDGQFEQKYEPHVFYYDQFREEKSLRYEEYQAYNFTQDNLEDIVYNRYSKELSDTLKNGYLGSQQDAMNDLLGSIGVDGSEYESGFGDRVPDIQQRQIIKNSSKYFLEIFNKSSLGESKKAVFNAGRYNDTGKKVNVDFVSTLVTTLDTVSEQVVKSGNTELENYIDGIVKNGLARDIPIATKIEYHKKLYFRGTRVNACNAVSNGDVDHNTYYNYFHGQRADILNNPQLCSIYRGSIENDGQLVEANRANNLRLLESGNTCQLNGQTLRGEACYALSEPYRGDQSVSNCPSSGADCLNPQLFYAGSSPLNIETVDGFPELKGYDLDGAIFPVYDIGGAKKKTSSAHIPNPNFCTRNNFLLRQKYTHSSISVLNNFSTTKQEVYRLPLGKEDTYLGAGYRDSTIPLTQENNPVGIAFFERDFFTNYLDRQKRDNYTRYIYLNGEELQEARSIGNHSGCNDIRVEKYYYKTIPSYIEHKSPTLGEIGPQIENMMAPNLPIDRNRYIDFIGANGKYQKIKYPYLFRVTPDTTIEGSALEKNRAALKEVLDAKSQEINSIINNSDPASLSAEDREIYEDFLKNGNFPDADIDLYAYLSDKESTTWENNNQEKTVSFFESLVFAVHWNNLNSVNAKYKFIFEHYLSSHMQKDASEYPLPKNKQQYEIAYIGAPGDSQNMFVNLDPEKKGDNPYADVLSQNLNLHNTLFALNLAQGDVGGANNGNTEFVCAPPEGVPLWEWFPAVQCWLKELVPAKIGVAGTQCGVSFFNEDEIDLIRACSGDVNSDGVNDCDAELLEDAQLLIGSSSERYYYNKSGKIEATLANENGEKVRTLSHGKVLFELTGLEIPENSQQPFDDTNTKAIFDTNISSLNTPEARKDTEKYISFQDGDATLRLGVANRLFTSKGYDANARFRATLTFRNTSGEIEKQILSSDYEVQIRGDALFLGASKIVEDDGQIEVISENFITANDEKNIFLIDSARQSLDSQKNVIATFSPAAEKIVLDIANISKQGQSLDINYPLTLSVTKNGEDFGPDTTIESSELALYHDIGAWSEAGDYELTIQDSFGFTAKKKIQILPAVAEKMDINLSTSVINTSGVITSNIITLYDAYDNITAGVPYELQLKLDENIAVFSDTLNAENRYNVFEGFQGFRLKSTPNVGSGSVFATLYSLEGEELFTQSANFRTQEGMTLELTKTSAEKIQVGEKDVIFEIEVKGADGSLVSDFDSRAYMILPQEYGSTASPYFTLENGRGTLQFTTATLADENASFELQAEGIGTIFTHEFILYPEKPVSVQIYNSRSKIEAATNEFFFAHAELRDRYDNIVFDDNETELALEILEKYQPILTSNDDTITVQKGRADFKIFARQKPGLAYYKISATPSLQENIFTLPGQTPFVKEELTLGVLKNDAGLTGLGKKFFYEFSSTQYVSRFATLEALESSKEYQALPASLQNTLKDFFEEKNTVTITPVNANVGSVQTYYFWKGEAIQDNFYNSFYSVLLGGSYGNIAVQDYLASAMLFDENNASLAVTTLLGDPYARENDVTLSSTGVLQKIRNSDPTRDIEIQVHQKNGEPLTLEMIQTSFSQKIGEVHFQIENPDIQVCENGTVFGTETCTFSEEQTSIVSKAYGSYNIQIEENTLKLKNSTGATIFSFAQDGSLERTGNYYLEFVEKNTQNYNLFQVKAGDTIIADIALRFIEPKFAYIKNDALLEVAKSTLSNALIISMTSNRYGVTDFLDENGSGKSIFYIDPFGDDRRLNRFAQGQEGAFEQFQEKKFLGWEKENKALLSFAAGEHVGMSTQAEQSFYLINLGDPVVSLSQEKKQHTGTVLDKNFDPTIGAKVSQRENIKIYRVFDYNNDNRDDILLYDEENYFSLLENTDTEQNFLDRGSLAYVTDIGERDIVEVGDVSGDGFDDVFFVNKNGLPFLLNNFQKDFYRISLEEVFGLKGGIVRARVFDMDDDGISDIVTLDDAGEIHIFYGKNGNPKNPEFQKKFIGGGIGITLNEESDNTLGAVYFDGLYQINTELQNQDIIDSNEALLAEIEAGPSTAELPLNEGILDGLIYDQLSHTPTLLTESSSESATEQTVSLEELDTIVGGTQQNPQTTFIQGKYADTSGIRVEKTFTDVNGGFLKGGDSVAVEVRLKNTTGTRLENIAYAEFIPQNFFLDSEILAEKELRITETGGKYSFVLDGFSLAGGAEILFTYTLQAYPFTYGYIDVGLFESGEVGNDAYGDILVKDNHKNCSGTPHTLYRSTAKRSYQKGESEARCDSSDLPESIEKNAKDDNNNGIPDYIDALQNAGAESDKLEEYAREALSELNVDTDGDSIPDSDDRTPYLDDDEQSLFTTLNDPANIEKISQGVDNIMEGLGCGFGGGSCIATPMNWAPLAAGNDPTLFGTPIGDGLHTGEGIPIFSAFTGLNIPTPGGCFQAPVVWPVMPFRFQGSCTTSLGAGGYLKDDSPTNFFRLYVSPTLTGGIGTAACFGGPAKAAGSAIPPGVSPVLPGGNCIVIARPMSICSADGSNGDVSSLGYPQSFGDGTNGGYGVIHGNCGATTPSSTSSVTLPDSLAQEYANYKRTGSQPSGFASKVNDFFSGSGGSLNNGAPLLSLNGGGSSDLEISLDITGSNENFSDVQKVQNQRISPFPDFIMDWVTRQIEEFVTKLTDFPDMYIILPDFSGLVEADFGKYFSGIDDAYKKGAENIQQENKNLAQKIANLQAKKEAQNCSSISSSLACVNLDAQISKLRQQKNAKNIPITSGISEVYEFLGNMPLVNVEPQTIPVEIPWVDQATLSKALGKWTGTLEQWKAELDRAKKQWVDSYICTAQSTYSQEECKRREGEVNKLTHNADQLIRSLERNIQVLESYKTLPRDINKNLIRKKEEYLNQILCNIDSYTALTGGWIKDNGKRFKAWAELWVTIKAILKSWQLMVDLFADYEAECHTCKNERNDLLYFTFKLVSFVIPKIPVIQFPAWPDIFLDLHNVRMQVNLALPEFEINTRPILLPILPNLYLPDSPSVDINLPQLPVLPTIEIPELPDLPGLPSLQLPNLPPPPKLPKLFASIEGVLNILKLVTKALCILGTSPFVPEWRAGDQIALLTERSGYLPTDFLDVSLPQFSMPTVEAIKIASYVNLELDTQFVVDFAQQAVLPLNAFSNDISHILRKSIGSDLDFSGLVPSNVTIDLNKESSRTSINLFAFAQGIAASIQKLHTHIENEKDETLGARDFISVVNNQLAQEYLVQNRELDGLRNVWQEAAKIVESDNSQLQDELFENNQKKFEELKDILKEEIQKTQNIEKQIENIGNFSSVSFEDTASFEDYNNRLSVYNVAGKEAVKKLLEPETTKEIALVQEQGEKLLAEVQSGVQNFANLSGSNSSGGGTCNGGGQKSDYGYDYEGIYIIESGRQYRLFSYIDELNGDEETTSIDFDADGDEDLLYEVDGVVYLKENLYTKHEENHTLSSFVLEVDNNDVYAGNYLPAVNNFRESVSENNTISFDFSASTNPDIHQYEIEYFPIMDATMNRDDIAYRPENIRSHLIDSFADIPEQTFIEETDFYTTRNNLGMIDFVGNNMAGIQVKTKKMKNIRLDLQKNSVVSLSAGTPLYAGANDFKIDYYISDPAEQLTLKVSAGKNVTFKNTIKIIGLKSSAYIAGQNVEILATPAEIRALKNTPLLPGFAIIAAAGNYTEASHIDFTYFDGTQRAIHGAERAYFEIYDLGDKNDNYNVFLSRENDYYYPRIRSFDAGLFGTFSKQILLSPQLASDSYSPELDLRAIRVPVYQQKTIDLTDAIYENSGIKFVKDLFIDFDLTVDSDGDGDAKNDNDSDDETNNIDIQKNAIRVSAKFGSFDFLIKKKIGFHLEDYNGNKSFYTVDFEVYAPTPAISSATLDEIRGKLNEDISDEPLNLYRYRGGVVSKMNPEINSIRTNEQGDYSYFIEENISGKIKVEKNGQLVAKLDEKTGRILTLLPGYTTKVYRSNSPSNEFAYPKLVILDADENEVYRQYVFSEGNLPVKVGENFDTETPGVQVRFLNTAEYNFYTLPEQAEYAAGAVVVYNIASEEKRPLFTIFRDGRIETFSGNYGLAYGEVDDKGVYVLRDNTATGKDIAQVYVGIDGNYLMR